jgi:hypothetical protein
MSSEDQIRDDSLYDHIRLSCTKHMPQTWYALSTTCRLTTQMPFDCFNQYKELFRIETALLIPTFGYLLSVLSEVETFHRAG